MGGTAKNYAPTEIQQGPGELWVIGSAPSDANVRLTLAADGTPDTTAHPGSVHLGSAAGAVTTTVKPKIVPVTIDPVEGPVDTYVSELEAKIEAELAQTESTKLQRLLGIGTYSTAAGYKQVTFGGTYTVPKACIAMISATRANPNRYVVSILYNGVATSGFSVALTKAKAASLKALFQGLADTARTQGKQVGVLYQMLADAAGGTPTAKATNVAEIYEGTADLWVIDAPADGTPRVTLDAATLTPDAAAHPNAVHLGMTTGAVTFSVMPKLDMIMADQFDAAVDATVGSLEAKIEAEMNQSAIAKLDRALAVGSYTLSGGAYEQTTFGGKYQPPALCVCAIGKKRTDTTKAVVGCLYRVNSADGVQWLASRTKPNTYKLTFTGQSDTARTLGRQIGIFHEMI